MATCGGNTYTEFIILDIKFDITCRELNLHGSTVNCKDFLSVIVDGLNDFFYFYSFQLLTVFLETILLCDKLVLALKNFFIFQSLQAFFLFAPFR